MKEIIFNEDNVTEDEVDKIQRKVRGIILNDEGKALVSRYYGLYMLTGGSIGENEDKKDALRRELQEETGIEEVDLEEEAFLKISSYNKNYYDRKLKDNITRLTETYFYYGKTNQKIDLNKQNLTESEKKGDFSVFFENLSIIKYLVETSKTEDSKRSAFDREILKVLDEFSSYMQEKEETKEIE